MSGDNRNESMSALDEILGAFTSKQVNIDELPEGDPAVELGRCCEALFTGGVDALRSIFPNDRVRALARVVWDLVGHKQVGVAFGPDVPSLAFTVMQHRSVHQGLVLVPKRWPLMVQEDAFMQLGAILFVGAQVVDFYNDRLISDRAAPRRWHAYEAEFLRTLRQHLPGWTPNDYQRQILEKFPDGLDTAGVDLYPIKAYAPARGTA